MSTSTSLSSHDHTNHHYKMAVWNLFGFKKTAESHTHRHKLHRSFSADSLITSSSAGSSLNASNLQNVSTQSSTKDIFKSVSAANAAAASSSAVSRSNSEPKLVRILCFLLCCLCLHSLANDVRLYATAYVAEQR